MVKWLSTDRALIPTEGEKNTRRGRGFNCVGFKNFLSVLGLVRV